MELVATRDSPVFQLPLEIRGYAAIFGSIIETSLSAVLGHAMGLCWFGKIPQPFI
ncbi:MAG: hypothetical protein IJH52_04250 [Oscillospiraceae bacterium]|nr:hypothetical protein [Oscillospiraceae bacterium]